MTRRWMLACVVMLAAAGSLAGRAQPVGDAGWLFSTGTDATAVQGVDQPAGFVTRSRTVRVAAERLEQDTLDLNLFSDLTLRVHRRAAGLDAQGTRVWSGRIEDEPFGTVTFVQAGDIVQGSIRSTRGAFSVEPVGNGPDHLIRQVDLRYAGPELLPRVPPLPRGPATATDPPWPALADSPGVVIDVLALYTSSAREQAGGSDAAVEARIALGIAETNMAYVNSRIPHRLRLVGTELAGYTESGDLAEDLERLTSGTDGLMDIVHSRRIAVGADLVTLVVGTTAGGACGVAWVMQNLSIDFAPYAFSVTAYPCISPNYTFAHELAHNMGSAHAPEDPNSPPVFPYSFGYKDPLQRFRTVMAYDCPAGCPRLLSFSNPAVLYANRPTGTFEHHNNALSLTQTGPSVATFVPMRAEADLLGAPATAGLDARGRTVTLTWSRPATGTPTGYAIEVGTAEGFSDVALLVVNDGTATSFLQPDVSPGTYFVRVRAFDRFGPSEPSPSVRLVMTNAGRCVAPAGPPLLRPSNVVGKIVTLDWQAPDTGGPVDGYIVSVGTRPQSADIGAFETGSTRTEAATQAGPGVYFVRVAATNACGIGPPSNEVGIVVGPPAPGPPTGVAAAITLDRRVTISWQPPSAGGPVAYYVVEAGSAAGRSNLAVLPTSGAATSLSVTASPGRYHVRVRALNKFGASVASEEIVLQVL